MFFSFVVRRLSFLKLIPLFPQIYDSLIKLWMVVTAPARLNQLDAIEDEVLSWKHTSVSLHQFGGTQFNFNKKEFAHIHSNGILDICFTKAIKGKLLLANKVEDHHLFKKSGWISFYVRNDQDVTTAIALLKLAYSKHADY